MKTLTDQLAQYAAYHRDRRNINTHLFGIPMIVVAVATLLSRPAIELPALPLLSGWTPALTPMLTPALPLTLALMLYYLLLDRRHGVVMAVLLALAVWAGNWLAAQSTPLWLGAGIGLFVIGWILQFIGHAYEGRKPAFVDDVIGLAIGPLFIVAEIGFALGWSRNLQQAIEQRVGPVHGATERSRRAASGPH